MAEIGLDTRDQISRPSFFFHVSICLYIYVHILIQRQEQMSVSFACVHGLFNVGELMSLGGGKIDASPSAPSCVSWEFRQRRFFYPSFQNGNPFVKRNINLSLSIVIVTPVFFLLFYIPPPFLNGGCRCERRHPL